MISNPVLAGLKPEPVWRYFAEICRIPHGSKNEAAIVRYVLGVADKLGLPAVADALGNVVIRKPASPGWEGKASIALQGHLDMVCEKNADKVHDFSSDPIELVRKENFLMANGTTLGADNGIGVAFALAVLEDTSLEHGPLEVLFTVDEETGLTGAAHLSGDMLNSRILINLDSEEDYIFSVGCAGGRDTSATWKLSWEPVPSGYLPVTLKVLGLQGGHSGIDIHKNRGNAIKIMNRVVSDLLSLGARIARMESGNKHNAIPREAVVAMALPPGRLEIAKTAVERWDSTVRDELGVADKGINLTLQTSDSQPFGSVLTEDCALKLCRIISAIPHGVIKMSSDIPDLVETSTNLAIVNVEKESTRIVTSQRSSVASEIEEICQSVASLFRLSGGEVRQTDGYPGWKPNLASPVLQTCISTYKALRGKEPEIKAIHAGLECGLIGEKFPGMDMISIGPTMEGVHSPDERLHIDTVEPFWVFLTTVLKEAC